MNTTDRLSRFFEFVDREGLWTRSDYLRNFFEYLFGEVDLKGKRVLDVGAGAGLSSVYAACSGATRVVALEPEAEGSSSGMQETFKRMTQTLDVDEVELLPLPFQTYEAGDETFDVIFLLNSINHLDEEACTRLPSDAQARQSYVTQFKRMANAANPGARLVIADCSNRNFFASLGMRSPIAPNIEWHKHQMPGVWADLAAEAGFGQPIVRWSSFNRLGSLGRLLLGNRVAAYFLLSHFCLTLTKVE